LLFSAPATVLCDSVTLISALIIIIIIIIIISFVSPSMMLLVAGPFSSRTRRTLIHICQQQAVTNNLTYVWSTTNVYPRLRWCSQS